MPIDPLMSKRFDELANAISSMSILVTGGLQRYYAEAGWRKWATSAQHLIATTFGEHSPHYRNFTSLWSECQGFQSQVDGLRGVFLAAREDYEGGYSLSLNARISGDPLGDFVNLARAALDEDAKDVAAVLACAALEDALKRFAAMNELEVSDKVIQDVVNALKSKGLVTGAQKSLLESMPKIRDYAMHANWAKITGSDVASVIGFVERFLLEKFS